MERNLQNNVSEMTKVRIRFPNESCFDTIMINMDEFKTEQVFKDEIFGWYKGAYVSISKL